jgi:hypothetical protein
MSFTHQVIVQVVALHPGITSKNLWVRVQETWPEVSEKYFDKAMASAAEKGLICEEGKQLWLTDAGSTKIKKDPLLHVIRNRILDLDGRIKALEKKV